MSLEIRSGGSNSSGLFGSGMLSFPVGPWVASAFEQLRYRGIYPRQPHRALQPLSASASDSRAHQLSSVSVEPSQGVIYVHDGSAAWAILSARDCAKTRVANGWLAKLLIDDVIFRVEHVGPRTVDGDKYKPLDSARLLSEVLHGTRASWPPPPSSRTRSTRQPRSRPHARDSPRRSCTPHPRTAAAA